MRIQKKLLNTLLAPIEQRHKMEIESTIIELLDIAKACENASQILESEKINDQIIRLESAIREVGRASSNSWLGYQSCVYYRDFQVLRPGDHFSSEWGFNGSFVQPVSENWAEYARQDVTSVIFQLAGFEKENIDFTDKALETKELFEEIKNKASTLLTVILEFSKSEFIEEIRDEIKKLKSHFSKEELISYQRPKGSFMSRDALAVSQGMIPPPHIALQCWLYSWRSYFTQIKELAKKIERATTYLRQKYRNTTSEKSIAQGKIFIGHGQSMVWKDLSYFLAERLHLEWDEFNRESSAGISIKERLEVMLDNATFAFLIMTAEDEHKDKSLHARENVIHEVGLFQGRLTFKRAIILLEEGCEEFSNIHGVGQVRFPKGNIKASFEDIRMVLEREGLIAE